MKIQQKTKLYGFILKEISLFLNGILYFLLRYFATEEWSNVRHIWVLIPSAIFITVFAIFDYINYDQRTQYNQNRMNVLFFAASSILCIGAFLIKINYGIIMLCCFFLECALIPVIEYRWRIVNKIKAHFKKKHNKK